jgi:hypothetical protein
MSIDDHLQRMEQLLKSNETALIRLDFPLYDLAPWQPGKQIRIKRQEMDGQPALHAATSSGPGYLIVVGMLAPFLVPITGFVIGLGAHIWPGDRVRLYLTICELFQFGWPVACWIPVIWCAVVVAIWLRLEAAFAPHDVLFDWQQQRFSVRSRVSEVVEPLQSVKELVVLPCLPPGGNAAAATSPDLLMRVLVRLQDGREIPILEAGGVDDADVGKDRKPSLERIAPVVTQLSAAMDVRYTVVPPVEEAFDIVGFPIDNSWGHWSRIWKLAGPASRKAMIAFLLLLFAGIGVIGGFIYSAIDTNVVQGTLTGHSAFQMEIAVNVGLTAEIPDHFRTFNLPGVPHPV